MMTGFHQDSDGSSYGGYGKKENAITHGVPAISGFPGIANSTWSVMFGEISGQARFGLISESSIDGIMTMSDGSTRPIEANLSDEGKIVSFWLAGSSVLARGRFLNHEPGLLCGSTNNGQAFYAAYGTGA